MGAPQYTDLLAALSAVPDPRHRRGHRYAWPLLLTLVAAALASGERNLRAIGQWVGGHAEELAAALDPPRGRLPSTATPRRALRAVDLAALERCLTALVRHGDGAVLGQVAVAAKDNGIAAAPRLLAGRDPTGTVTTLDALLPQRAIAAQVLRRTCRRVIRATWAAQEGTTYGVTSLPPAAATSSQPEALWRGHWTIENRVHSVRDVTLGEDTCQVRAGNAPQALAALRNGLLTLPRLLGWPLSSDALRHYGAYAHRALALLSASPVRLRHSPSWSEAAREGNLI